MSTFDTDVRIERSIDDVFAYVSDPLNMPHWYSAVQAVRSVSEADRQVGATYLMERQLPGGTARNELEIVSRDPPTQFTMRTTSGPPPLTYRYRFSRHAGGTFVELHATFSLDGIAAIAGPLGGAAQRRPRRRPVRVRLRGHGDARAVLQAGRRLAATRCGPHRRWAARGHAHQGRHVPLRGAR